MFILVELLYYGIILIILLTAWHYFDIHVICALRKKKSSINQNSTILITGGCMGIGRQTALKFSQQKKSKIIIVDIRDDLSKKILSEIQENGIILYNQMGKGGQGYFYKCDLTQPVQIQIVFEEILKQFPRIDVLINNAGLANLKHFKDTNITDFQRVTQVNYLAPVQIIQIVLPRMEKQGEGHIVNIASVVSIIPGIKTSEYVASKHALWGFHQSLRIELKIDKQKINTTIICPWAINTGMFKGLSTNLDFLLPGLDEKYVGLVIYDSILQRREVVFINHGFDYICHVLRLLPWGFIDFTAKEMFKGKAELLVGRNKQN